MILQEMSLALNNAESLMCLVPWLNMCPVVLLLDNDPQALQISIFVFTVASASVSGTVSLVLKLTCVNSTPNFLIVCVD